MEPNMKFHHFFKWYLLFSGITAILTNTVIWVGSFFEFTILTVTISAKDVWVHIDYVIHILLAVMAIYASGQLRRMTPRSLGGVYGYLWLYMVSIVSDCVSSFLNGTADSYGLYLGYAMLLVVCWKIFVYYRKRKEWFIK